MKEIETTNYFELGKFSSGNLLEVPVVEGGSAIFEIITEGSEPIIDLKSLPEGRTHGPAMKLFGSVVLDAVKYSERLEKGLVVVGGNLAVAATLHEHEQRHIALSGTISSLKLLNRLEFRRPRLQSKTQH